MNKYNILCFVVCIVLQALVSKAFEEKDLDETDWKCLQEHNIDKNIVFNSYDENNFIKEGNPEMNKFYGCAWRIDKLQNDDGSINVSNLEKIVKVKLEDMFPDHANYRSHLAHASVNDCKDVKGSDNGDTCVKVYNCILNKVGEISQHTKPEDFAD